MLSLAIQPIIDISETIHDTWQELLQVLSRMALVHLVFEQAHRTEWLFTWDAEEELFSFMLLTQVHLLSHTLSD